MKEKIIFNRSQLNMAEVKNMAEDIFSEQNGEFHELKNRTWYQKVINAITLGSSDKKIIVKDIKNIATLQRLFMNVYQNEVSNTQSEVGAIIENCQKTNEFVKNMYLRLVACIEFSKKLDTLSEDIEKPLLLLFLSDYQPMKNEQDVQRYRRSLSKNIGQNMPDGQFNPAKLELVNHADIFYRCIVEISAIDDNLLPDSVLFPESIKNSLEYLNLSPKKKEEIEDSVRREMGAIGVDGLIEKYDRLSNVIEIDSSDMEWSEVDNSNPQSDAMMSLGNNMEEGKVGRISDSVCVDREEDVIADILFVEKETKKLFSGKEIQIKGIIECEGIIEFRDCAIHYDCFNTSGSIILKGESQLIIENCDIICHGGNKKYAEELKQFDAQDALVKNKVGSDYVNVQIVNSSFFDCADFLQMDGGSVVFNHNHMMNCINPFFYLKGCDGSFEWNDFEVTQNYAHNHFALIKILGCNFPVKNSHFHFEGEANIGGDVIHGDEILNCTFEGNRAHYACNAKNIRNCFFNNCEKAIFVDHHGEVEDCIFENCYKVIWTSVFASIKHCRFYGCNDRIIESDSMFMGGGVKISFCHFINFRSMESKKSYDSGYDAAIMLLRSNDAEVEENRVEKCVFDGCEMGEKWYLIASEEYNGWSGTKNYNGISTKVSECFFRNIRTRRNDLIVIKPDIQISGLFGKRKTVTVNECVKCVGLDRVNQEGSTADSGYQIDRNDRNGNPIGVII